MRCYYAVLISYLFIGVHVRPNLTLNLTQRTGTISFCILRKKLKRPHWFNHPLGNKSSGLKCFHRHRISNSSFFTWSTWEIPGDKFPYVVCRTMSGKYLIILPSVLRRLKRHNLFEWGPSFFVILKTRP